MSIPHHLHIYERVFSESRGNRFLKRYQVANWKHRIAAMGWFDTASCDIQVPLNEAELIFKQYLGSRVALYVDSPVIAWEGYIDRITFEVGGVKLTRGFDGMMNRVTVTFWDDPNGEIDNQTSTGNAQSRLTYGRKEGEIEAGINWDSDQTSKQALRDTLLGQRAWPQISEVFGEDSGLVLRLEMRGFYYLLDWTTYETSSTASLGPDNLIRRLTIRDDLGDTSYNAPFIINTTTQTTTDEAARFLEDNTAWTISAFEDSGVSHWAKILQITEAGDGTNRWIAGITPFDRNTGYRYAYYRQADTTNIKYVVKALGSPKVIRNPAGALVRPWFVRPDGLIRVSDILQSYTANEPGNDPTRAYIEAVEYDAESQSVAFQSGDDITLRGFFAQDKFAEERRGPRKPNGAPRRVVGTASGGGGSFANQQLSNLGTTAVNADIIPASADVRGLGTNSLYYQYLYSRFVRFPASTASGSFSNNVLGRNDNALTYQDNNGAYGWFPRVFYTQTAITTKTSSNTSFADITDDTGALGSLTFYNAVKDGVTLVFTIAGALDASTSATGSLEFEFRQGTTTRATFNIAIAAAQDRPFVFTAMVRRTAALSGLWQAALAATHLSVTNSTTAVSGMSWTSQTWNIRARFTSSSGTRTLTVTHIQIEQK